MSEAPTIICSESGVALALDERVIYPLTRCCQATAKGCDGYIGCRACYAEVDPAYGDCWSLDEESGWNTYRYLLATYVVFENAKADEIVSYAKEKAAATGLATAKRTKVECYWDATAKEMKVRFV